MNFDRLQVLMKNFVDEGYAPGNTLIVNLGGKEVFNYTYGLADVASKKAMTGDEHFYLYSCSKITTVVAALMLLERGKFLLSDPLCEYMPEFSDMYIKRADGEFVKAKQQITIKNLFNMTAGFTYETDTQAFLKAKELTKGKMDTETVIKCLSEEPLAFESGERFLYSLCHDVLARLVEVISGKRFSEYVKDNIFGPLNMNSSVYHLTTEIKNNMATLYRFVPEGSSSNFDIVEAQRNGSAKNGIFVDEKLENELIFGEEYDSGGAGIISKASDYIKLAAALANWGTGLDGEHILSPYTVELLRTNSLNDKQLKTYDWPQLKGYGYGLGVRTMMDISQAGAIGHKGEFAWGGAAGATVLMDPEIGLSAVYLKHTLNPREEYYMPKLRNVIYSCLK